MSQATTWTEDRVQTLTTMFAAQATYIQIAEALGLTEKAVGSKISRMRLTRTCYGNKIILTQEQEEAFRADWLNAALSLPALERKWRISTTTLRRIAGDLGLEARAPGNTGDWTPEKTEEAAKLYRDGVTPRLIAARFGMTRNQVTAKLDRMGVLVRRSGPAPSAPKLPTSSFRAPEVKRAPYTGAGLNFKTRTFGDSAAAKPQLIICGNSAVIEKPAAQPSPVPPIKAAAWAPLPGVTPMRFIDAAASHCKWPIELSDGAYWCCGAVATEGSYCKAHHRRSRAAVQPPKKIKPPFEPMVRMRGRAA